MNAESRLKYPAVFAGKERRVYLEGEAYFDVARDTAKPFFVETREQSVRVLGTAFNVCAYAGESVNYATLVRGRVLVEDKQTGVNRVLRPGEQVCLNVSDGEAVVREVDVRKEIAWKDGLFVFNGQTLEQIMGKLAVGTISRSSTRTRRRKRCSSREICLAIVISVPYWRYWKRVVMSNLQYVTGWS